MRLRRHKHYFLLLLLPFLFGCDGEGDSGKIVKRSTAGTAVNHATTERAAAAIEPLPRENADVRVLVPEERPMGATEPDVKGFSVSAADFRGLWQANLVSQFLTSMNRLTIEADGACDVLRTPICPTCSEVYSAISCQVTGDQLKVVSKALTCVNLNMANVCTVQGFDVQSTYRLSLSTTFLRIQHLATVDKDGRSRNAERALLMEGLYQH